MPAKVTLRSDFDALQLRQFAKRSSDTRQTCRLLALAAVYDGMSRGEAAKVGGMDRQTLRDWVHRFNDLGPDGLVNSRGPKRKRPADQRYQNAYLFGAICPKMGKGAALMLPFSNTAAMQIHLNEISRHVAPKAHGVVLMDRAGWHTTGKLNTPKNITIILLPSRAPELNPVENIWQYIRSNWLSNRVFDDYEAILDAECEAWNKLLAQPETIKSIGMRDWAHVSQS